MSSLLVMEGQLKSVLFFHPKHLLLLSSGGFSDIFKRPALTGEIKVMFWCRLFFTASSFHKQLGAPVVAVIYASALVEVPARRAQVEATRGDEIYGF